MASPEGDIHISVQDERRQTTTTLFRAAIQDDHFQCQELLQVIEFNKKTSKYDQNSRNGPKI